MWRRRRFRDRERGELVGRIVTQLSVVSVRALDGCSHTAHGTRAQILATLLRGPLTKFYVIINVYIGS